VNFTHFFGKPFAELFGQIGSKIVSALISVMLAFSFGFFAMLKNQKMVAKTFWLLPADLAIAFILTNLQLSETVFMWVSSFIFIAYLIQFAFIIFELSRLFVGKGIEGKETEHYEKVFGTLFES
jgi:ABC-type Na+ efflux pump permease subunit